MVGLACTSSRIATTSILITLRDENVIALAPRPARG